MLDYVSKSIAEWRAFSPADKIRWMNVLVDAPLIVFVPPGHEQNVTMVKRRYAEIPGWVKQATGGERKRMLFSANDKERCTGYVRAGPTEVYAFLLTALTDLPIKKPQDRATAMVRRTFIYLHGLVHSEAGRPVDVMTSMVERPAPDAVLDRIVEGFGCSIQNEKKKVITQLARRGLAKAYGLGELPEMREVPG